MISHPKGETMIEDVSEHSVKENNWNYEKGSDRTMREKKNILYSSPNIIRVVT